MKSRYIVVKTTIKFKPFTTSQNPPVAAYQIWDRKHETHLWHYPNKAEARQRADQMNADAERK